MIISNTYECMHKCRKIKVKIILERTAIDLQEKKDRRGELIEKHNFYAYDLYFATDNRFL